MDSSELHSSLSSSSAGGHLPPGATLGAYRILRRIAMGGMGAVYEAEHAQLGRRVAIKTMLYDEGGIDTQRFLNEARLIAALDHPNIVRVFDAGEAAGVRFLAMELIEGPTLSERLEREGLLDVDDAVDLLRQVATGVHAAHEAGILHRDLKPSNVLVDADGRARLGDFGTARSTTDQRLTVTGVVIGTPSYMAPEQAMGDPDAIGPAVDVYGLGATLYHLLAGQPPFERGSQLATMQAVVAEPVPDPRSVRRGLSADLVAVCMKCLAKAPEDRYATAGEVADDLSRFLAGEPTVARPIGLAGRAVKAVRRNALIVSATTLLTLVFAVLVVLSLLPSLLSRNLLRLEAAAQAWRGSHLATLTTELDQTDLSPERLRGLRSALSWESFQSAGLTALQGGDDLGRIQAITRGLGERSTYRAQVDPLRAAIALRLADVDGVGELAEAAVRDPKGPAGRAARLRLALQLADGRDRRGRDLATAELHDLSSGGDGPALRARLGLARGAACRNDWTAAFQALSDLTPREADDRATARHLRAMARLLSPTTQLPPAQSYALLPGDPLRLAHHHERVVHVQALASTSPATKLDFTGAGLTVQAIYPVQGWGTAILAIVIRAPKTLQVFQASPQGLGVHTIKAFETRSIPSVRAHAAGDFDGDGATDLALIPYDQGQEAIVIFGGPSLRTTRLFPPRARRPFAFRSAAAADLDGDGTAELLLAPSLYHDRIEVFRHDPASKRLRPLTSIPSPRVVELSTLPLGPKKTAVIASIDYHPSESARLPRSKTQPWVGRDGLLTIADPGSGPQLVGRWTAGPDEPPTGASARLLARVRGFGLTLDGVHWVVRSSRDLNDRARWELTPWSSLNLERNPPAPVQLPGARGSPSHVVDLDGDGDREYVFGATLHGLGPAPKPSSVARRSARVGTPTSLLRVARQMRVLGHSDVTIALLARLNAEHPDAWAAQIGQLEAIDDLLWRARRSRLQAGRRFRTGAVTAGAQADEDALRLFAQAAEQAELRAPEASLSGACWAKAAHARMARGEYEAARQALDAALGQDDLSGDQQVRLAAERQLLARHAALTPFSPVFIAKKAGLLGVLRPRGARFVSGDAVSIRVDGGVEDGVLAGVEIDPRPLRVDAHVTLGGNTWSGRLRFGLAPASHRTRMTGIEVGLHSVATNRLSIEGIAGGKKVGLTCDLPRFDPELRLRFDLTPLAGGESRMRLQVRDGDRRLLFSDSVVRAVSAPVGGPHLAGVVAPRAGNRNSLNQEQRGWRMRSWTTVHRLEVSGLQPQPRPDLLAREWISHSYQVAGAFPQAAMEAKRSLPADPPRAGAGRWALGLVRGRASDPAVLAAGARDLLAVARHDPHQALLWFEDLAEELEPNDRPVVDAALDLLSASPDPLLVAIASSLRGRLRVRLDMNDKTLHRDVTVRRMTIAHLHMRNVHAPHALRYRYLLAYLNGGRDLGARLPRAKFPRVILDARRLSLADLGRLLTPSPDAVETQHRLLLAITLAPQRPEPWSALAQLYERSGLLGLAESAALESLSRTTAPADRRATLLSLAALRVRSHRTGRAIEALDRYLKAGGSPAGLKPFAAKLGGDPRFKALLGR